MTIRADRLRQVMAHIDANPDRWDQRAFRKTGHLCGTSHCFMGWAQHLAGKQINAAHTNVMPDACEWLGVNIVTGWRIAKMDNTLADLHRIVDELCAPAEPAIREDRQLVPWSSCVWQPPHRVTP